MPIPVRPGFLNPMALWCRSQYDYKPWRRTPGTARRRRRVLRDEEPPMVVPNGTDTIKAIWIQNGQAHGIGIW